MDNDTRFSPHHKHKSYCKHYLPFTFSIKFYPLDWEKTHYRQLLESLRKFGILARSVAKAKAIAIARNRRIPVKHVPQFSVRPPSSSVVTPKIAEADDDADYSKVYVVNIAYNIKEQDLIDTLSVFGSVADVSIPINRYTGLARGFAFVEFERKEDAQKALASSGKLSLAGRTLYLQKYESRT
jgi:hypothetical protein